MVTTALAAGGDGAGMEGAEGALVVRGTRLQWDQCQEEPGTPGAKAAGTSPLSSRRAGEGAPSLPPSAPQPKTGYKAGELPGFPLLNPQRGALRGERHCRNVMGGLGCRCCGGGWGEMVFLALACGGVCHLLPNAACWCGCAHGLDALGAELNVSELLSSQQELSC